MLNDIMKAVQNLLTSSFSDCPVYMGNIQKDFTRKCFLVTYCDSEIENLNLWTYKDTLTMEIIYFASCDNRGVPDAAEQYSTYDALKKIFSKGFIPVNDRKIKINKIIGGTRDDLIKDIIGEAGCSEIFIKLSLDVTESREEVLDNKEPAGSVEFKLQEV
jgi:hypothetical protein